MDKVIKWVGKPSKMPFVFIAPNKLDMWANQYYALKLVKWVQS